MMVGDDKLEVGPKTQTLRPDAASGDVVFASRGAQLDDVPDDRPATAPARQPIPPARLRSWLISSDAVALVLALIVATSVQAWARPIPGYIRAQQFKLAIVALPLWLVAMGLNRLFTARALVRRSEEFRRLLSANALGTGFI